MSFFSLRKLFAGKTQASKRSRNAKARREKPKGRQWTFERLEDRTVPSTLLTTDKTGYAPTDVATFTGSGFQASENVDISVVETRTDGSTATTTWSAGDDANGNFTATYAVPTDAPGNSFTVTAAGESGDPTTDTASTAFNGLKTWVYTLPTDYLPGQTANIYAGGFSTGETVDFKITNLTTGTVYSPWSVTDGVYTTDPTTGAINGGDLDGTADGHIQTGWVVPDDAFNCSLQISATGETSALTAQNNFTDSGLTAASATSVSADTMGGTFTSLAASPQYQEAHTGDVTTGTIILDAPSGFAFDTGGTAPSVAVTHTGTGSQVGISLTSRTSSQITYTVNSADTGSAKSTLTFNNIRVRPTAGTPLASGNIVDDAAATATLAGVTKGSSNWGTLNEVPGAASKVVFGQQPTNDTAGQKITPAVTVKVEDQSGNVVTSDSSTVTLTLSSGTFEGGSNTATATASGGVATFSNLKIDTAGTYTLLATDGSLTSATSNSFTISALAASQVVFTTSAQTLTAGVTSSTMTIQLEDQFGNVVTADAGGQSVNLSTTSAGVFRDTTDTTTITSVTIASGSSTASFKYNDTLAGTPTLTAHPPGLTAANQVETVNPAAASQLVLSTQPSATATAGVAFATQPVVKEEDAFGNVITSDSTHTVTAARDGVGTDVLHGTTTITFASGVATFSGLFYDKAETMDIAFATNAGSFSVTSNNVVVSPAAANMLAFAQGPTNTTYGNTISPAVTVAIEDQFGNVRTSDTTNVALSIHSGTGASGAALSGGGSTAAVAGVATFSNLQINKAAAGYELDATASGLTTATSGAFNINQRAITVTAAANSKTYDATTSATATPTITSGTLASGDSGTFTESYDNKDVGTTHVLTPAGTIKNGSTDVTANYNITFATISTGVITAKTLTVSGLSATNKTYDATTTDPLTGTAALLSADAAGSSTTDGHPYTGDTVTLGGTAVGTFASKDVANSIGVTVTGNSLSGAQAGDYLLAANEQSGLTANITPKTLYVSGLSTSNKVYDATTTATLSGTASLLSNDAAGASTADGHPYTGDTVSLNSTAASSFTGTFSSKDAANSIVVKITGNSLTGAQAGDYVLSSTDEGNSAVTANITPKALTYSGLSVAASKVYDGTTNAVVSGTAALQASETAGSGTTSDGKAYTGDAVSLTGTATGTYNSKDVASANTVTFGGLSLTGNQAGDYSITASTQAATITSKALTYSGLSVPGSKIYDGTTTAVVSGTAVLQATETAGSGTTADGKPYSVDSVSLTGTPTGTYNSKDVASATTVTFGGLSLTGTGSGNYSLTTATQAATITAKTLFISGLSASNKVYDATTAATLSGTAALLASESAGTGTTSDGKAYSGDTVSLNSTAASAFTGTFSSKDAANGIVVKVTGNSLTGAQAGDYVLSSSDEENGAVTANITPKALTYSGLSVPASKVYDGTTTAVVSGTATLQAAESAGSGTTADGKPYSGDTVSLTGTPTATYNTKDVATANLVTFSGVSLTGGNSSDYTLTILTQAATITAKNLTISGAVANNKVYDGNTSATVSFSGASLVGVVGSENVTIDSSAYSASFADRKAATGKAVTVSGVALGGMDKANYTVSQPSGLTANISPAPLTITAVTNTKTYDATTSAAAAPTVSGLQDSDTVTGLAEVYDNPNAGTGKTLSVSAYTVNDGNSGNNYTVTTVTNTTGVINKRALTVTAATNTKTYDGTTSAAATPTITAGSLQGTDTANFSETYDTKHAGTGKTLTPSGTVTDGNGGANYSYTFVNDTTGVINTRAITVTAAANTKTYDATTSAAATPTITAGTLASGDSGTFTEKYDTRHAGTGKTLTPAGTVQDSGNADVTADYNITFSAVTTGVINARALTVTAASNTKTYDGNTSAGATPTITAGALQGSDTANFIETYDNRNTGTAKTLTPSGTVSDGNSGNDYSYTFVNDTTGVINKAALTITATTNTKTYDGNTSAAATPTVSGLQDSDTVTGLVEAYTDRNAATGKTLTVTAYTVNDGNSGNNYTVTTVASAAGVINQADLTITATTNTKTYDGNTSAAATPTVSGLQDSDTVTGLVEAYTDRNAGTGKTLTITAYTVNDGNSGNNYTVSTVNDTTGVINKRALTVTATANSKTYDGTTSAAATPTITSGALQDSDTANFIETYDNRNAGTSKTLTPSGTVNDGNGGANYSYTFVSTTNGAITARAITVTAASDTKTYDGTASSTGSPTITSGSLATGDTTTNFSQVFDSRNAGARTLTASGTVNDGNSGNNYSYTFLTAAGTINQRALTVTAATNTKTYDDTTSAAAAPTITAGSLATGDSTTNFTETYDNRNAGTGKTLTPSGIVNDGNSGANYSYTFVTDTTGVINPLAITGSITAANKVYDATTAATITSRTLSGVLGTDDVSYVGGTATFSDKNVGTAKTVTGTGLGLSGTDAGNYTVNTTATTTADITRRDLTVTATGIDKTYDATTAATVTLSDNRVAGDVLTDSYTSASFADKNVATGKAVSVSGISISGTDAGNYNLLNTTATTTANITQRDLTVTASGINKTYDGTTTAAVTLSDNRVSGDVLTDSYTSATFSDKNVATGKTVSVSGIAISGTDAGNYNLLNTTAATTADITARTLHVTATADNKVYDGNTTAVAHLSDDRVAGDVFSDSYSSATFSDKNVAAGKTVTVSGIGISGTDAGNYTFNTSTTTTADITAKHVSGSFTSANKIYDATTAAAVVTTDPGAVVAGDDVHLSISAATFSDKNVATAKTVTANTYGLVGGDAGNYALDSVATTTADITARTLTVSASGINKTYDASTTATVNLSDDRVSGDVFSDSYTSANFSDKNVGTGKTLSVSGIAISGTDAGNYTFNTTTSTTADITQRDLTVTASGINKVYDGTTAATVTLSDNRVSGDVLTDSYTSATFSDKNVATGKAVSVSGIGISGTDAGNYNLLNTTAATTADITARTLHITATADNKVYDGNTTAVAHLSDDRVAGDVFSDSYTSATFSDKNVAAGKTVTVSGLSISGTDAANYTFNTSTNTTADITARTLTISATGINKTYDATTTATVNLSDDRVAGDVFTDSYNTANFSDKNVGTGKAVSVSGISISGMDAGNYTFNTTTSTTANITQRDLTVTATGIDKTYDATMAATVALSDNRVSGDVLTDSYTSASFADKNVAAGKAVSVSGISISGTDAGNYNLLNTAATTADITPHSLDIYATTDTKTYDATTNSTASPTTSGLQGSDTVTGLSESYDSKDAGARTLSVNSGYTINDGDGGNNYTVTLHTASGTINKADAVVTVNGYTGTYDAHAHGATGSVVGVDAGGAALGSSLDLGASFTNVPGGTAHWVFSGGTNYNDQSGDVAITINQAVATVNITPYSGVYDAQAHGISGSVTGVADETANLNAYLNLGASFTNVPGGTAHWVFSGSGNYTDQSGDAAVDISKADVSVSVTPYHVAYDATAHTATGSVSAVGPVNQSDLNLGGTTHTSAGTYTDTWTFTDTTGNYNNTSGTVTDQIDKVTPAFSNLAAPTITYGDGTAVLSGHIVYGLLVPTGSVSITLNSVTQTAAINGSGDFSSTFDTHLLAAGSYTITYDYTGDTNFNTVVDTSHALTVNQKALTITATDESKTYGDAFTPDGTTQFTTNGLVNSDSVSSVTLASAGYAATATFVAPGPDYAITASAAQGSGLSNYAITYAAGNLHISQRALTVTANNQQKTYGDTFTFAGTEFTTDGNERNGDSVTSVTLTSGGTAATATVASPGPDYAITASNAQGTGLGNYAISYVAGDLHVNPRNATVAANAKTKTYGDANPALDATVTGTANGDVLNYSLATSAAQFSNVGDYTITVTLGANPNYNVTAVNGNLHISARPVTVTADAQSKIYGDADPALTYQITSGNLVNGDSFSGGLTRAAGENVGSYAIQQGTLALSSNYSLTYIGANLSITPRDLHVGYTADDKVYDASRTATEHESDDRLNNDSFSVSYSTALFDTKNVGTNKTVTVSGIAISGAAAGNYHLVNQSATATANISTLAITGSITAANKVYDGTTSATITSRSLSGVVSGDDVSYVGGTATFSDKNVGTAKTVTGTGLGLSGVDAGNYTVNSTATTTADITARTLTVSASGINKTYDATTTATVNLSDNRVSGDSFSDSYTSANFSDKNVGTGKTVSVSGISISGTDAGNYTFNTTTSTTADITQRDLTVTASGINKTYDGTTTATVTLSDNRVSGDVLSDSYTGAAFADKNVANGKTVSVSGISISGTDAGNYHLTNSTTTTTANITARTLHITATADNKVYDGNTTAVAHLNDDRVSGDVFTDAYTSATFSDKNVAAGKTVSVSGISISGTDAANYTFNTSTTTTANIAQRSLTVSAAGINKVYDATTAASVTLSDNRVAGDSLTDSYSSAAFADKNVGTGKAVSVSGISISGTDAGNYALSSTTASTTANISPAPLTITAVTDSKTYDATTTSTATPTVSGLLGSDTVTGLSESYDSKNAGARTLSVNAGYTVNDGNSGNNYTVTLHTASGSISKANATVAVTGYNVIYDGLAHTATGTATGVGGDGTLSGLDLSGTKHTLVGVYTDTWTFTDATGNYNNASGSVTDQIGTHSGSAYVLNKTASGAVTVSGNAVINLPGDLVVDSNSTSAIMENGNANIAANSIQVVGGVSKTGNAAIGSYGHTAATGDPLNLVNLPASGTNYGAVSVAGTATMTLNPGIYSSISASGSATLNLQSGIYYIQGGGFTVTGKASVNGNSGVLIYNTVNGSANGGITLSGSGTFNLKPLYTSGAYANVLVFQPYANTRALAISGNAVGGLSGIIYAPAAALTMSGNAQLGSATNPITVIVNALSLSGNVGLSQVADGTGTTDNSGMANTLLAGNLNVYVSDPDAYLTADELARIQDAISTLDALLVPYNVTITEVSDSASANVVLDAAATSASGSAADGVLGCFNTGTNDITILEGWNWYAGSDPTQIGAGQYDFQTTVTHELGHALGLGHSSDANSAMYATLATGAAHRGVSTADLNIPDPPSGADPLLAAGFHGAATASANATSIPRESLEGRYLLITGEMQATFANNGNYAAPSAALASAKFGTNEMLQASNVALSSFGIGLSTHWAVADNSSDLLSGMAGTDFDAEYLLNPMAADPTNPLKSNQPSLLDANMEAPPSTLISPAPATDRAPASTEDSGELDQEECWLTASLSAPPASVACPTEWMMADDAGFAAELALRRETNVARSMQAASLVSGRFKTALLRSW